MATFSQNIKKIQGDAYRGSEIRTAIAEALRQIADVDITVDNAVVLVVDRIGATDDYRVEFIVGDT